MPEQVFPPLTPKLKDGNDRKISSFNKAGVWDNRQPIEIDNLAESLNIEGVPKTIELTGIPDMWARPILFEMALYDARHPLHKLILGEWRGLLAMIALKEWRNINLSTSKIEIISPDPNPQQPGGTLTQRQNIYLNQPAFLKALEKLRPSKTLSNDNNWHNLYIILFNNEPIGITSPTTLVCTAANYFNRINNVKWFDGNFLTDPTSSLNDKEKTALAKWLEQLKNNLQSHQHRIPGMPEYDRLLGLIDSKGDEKGGNKGFIQDLGGADPQVNIKLSTTIGITEGIFQHFNLPIEAEQVPPESHVFLKTSRTSIEPQFKKLLIVDKEIAKQWGKKEQEIFVSGTITLASIPFGGLGSDETKIGEIQLPSIVKQRSPDKFFTEKLFVIQQQNAFPGTMKIKGDDKLQFQGKFVTPILPIKEELLNYLTADDLYQRVVFESKTDGFVVHLRLPLSGPDNKGKDFSIQKEFKFKEEVVLLNTVPVLEVWPNFRINKLHGDKYEPAWKLYYTYFSTLGEQTFYAKPYIFGKELDKDDLQTFKDRSGRKIERQITRTDIFPEAMICIGEVANPQTNAMEPITAGILLLNRPDITTQVQNKKWLIGVDFGTTATNIHVNDTISDSFPIIFKERFLTVTATSRRTCLYDDFLPGKEEKAPLLSIFQDFSKTSGTLRPLLDGHIYFLEDYKNFNAAVLGIITDLKWSEDKAVRERTQAFLEQLCLQCVAEAAAYGVAEVSWRFSYPSAFSAVDIESFEKIWKQITTEWTETGFTSSPDNPVEKKTESIAASHFFAYHPKMQGYKQGLFGPGMVCMDIGGETSDITIYQDNKLHWQTSLRFAGRHVFLNLLYAKPDFLNISFGADVASLNKTIGNRTAFYAQADALINSQGQDWLDRLHHVAGDQKVKDLIQLIAVGLSGIFYYIGLQLQYLGNLQNYKKQMPNVYIGGNGAKMFHWLAVGAYSSKSPINTLFKDIILKASGFSSRPEMFDIHISPEPKGEASFGLVCEETDLDESSRIIGVLAGELFEEGSKKCNWDQLITAERMGRGMATSQKLQNLEDFINIFNSYAKSQNAVVSAIESNNILINVIKKQLDDQLVNVKGKDEKTIHVEPLFISELKTLLKIKADE
ncbi:MAG: cell division protein FtsA [Thermodesulfovibrionales bacterium]